MSPWTFRPSRLPSMIDRAQEFLRGVARRQAITIRRLDRLERALEAEEVEVLDAPIVADEPLVEAPEGPSPWWMLLKQRMVWRRHG